MHRMYGMRDRCSDPRPPTSDLRLPTVDSRLASLPPVGPNPTARGGFVLALRWLVAPPEPPADGAPACGSGSLVSHCFFSRFRVFAIKSLLIVSFCVFAFSRSSPLLLFLFAFSRFRDQVPSYCFFSRFRVFAIKSLLIVSFCVFAFSRYSLLLQWAFRFWPWWFCADA